MNERLDTLPQNARLFRINAGSAWAGEIIKRTADMIILKNPRPFHGAPKGWPDLAGWETVTVTPEMVGKKVAIFLGEEVKLTGGLNKYQKFFKEIIENMGGIFRVLK
jgi:hypothetical protein